MSIIENQNMAKNYGVYKAKLKREILVPVFVNQVVRLQKIKAEIETVGVF